ncbi:helix-turn-helix protein [Carboxydocella thermautotrophica]|nr:helix-turn-helix protein [Carboxydocella thermautotrophica]
MDIGKHIKKLRDQYELSMNELARRSGVAQSSISEIESGKRQPTFEVLERIISGFGLSFAEFFSEETPDMPPDLRQLLQEAESLTPEQRQLLTAFLKSLKGE